MSMKTNKKRRKEFRRALHDAQMIRPDRFTDMMHSIAAGGNRPCACCRLVYGRSKLDDRGFCPSCNVAVGDLRIRTREHINVTNDAEPHVVWADASFSDGIAGLGICGAFGNQTRVVDAKTSTQAEVMALRWAMEIAKAGNRCGLTFRTDCQAAYKAWHQTPKRFQWTVEQIPRRQNRRADALASAARLGVA